MSRPGALVCQDPQEPADRRDGRERASHVQHNISQAPGTRDLTCSMISVFMEIATRVRMFGLLVGSSDDLT